MGYFMDRKVRKYLDSKQESEYTVLDKILKMCSNGELLTQLKNNGLIDICINPEVKKKGGNLVCVYITVDFTKSDDFRVLSGYFEDHYEYVIYASYDAPEDVDNRFIQCKYDGISNVKDIFDLIIQDLIVQYNKKYHSD